MAKIVFKKLASNQNILFPFNLSKRTFQNKKAFCFAYETERLSLLIKENISSIVTVPNHWEQKLLLHHHLSAELQNLKGHSKD